VFVTQLLLTQFRFISSPMYFVGERLLSTSANLCASGTYVQSGGTLSFQLLNSGPTLPLIAHSSPTPDLQLFSLYVKKIHQCAPTLILYEVSVGQPCHSGRSGCPRSRIWYYGPVHSFILGISTQGFYWRASSISESSNWEDLGTTRTFNYLGSRS